jgi:hypothetical protein
MTMVSRIFTLRRINRFIWELLNFLFQFNHLQLPPNDRIMKLLEFLHAHRVQLVMVKFFLGERVAHIFRTSISYRASQRRGLCREPC